MTAKSTDISVCIPVYNEIELLKRCLFSLEIQKFESFEVIITDDSSNNDIEIFITNYKAPFPISYFRNNPALGSPINWNAAIKKATGKYIKIIHQDDWLATPESLRLFYESLEEKPESLFAFCISRDFVNNQPQPLRCDFNKELEKWRKNKSFLCTYNFIGDPSTIMFRNNNDLFYDSRMKWCVDTDFNLQLYEKNNNILFIEKELIHIGTHPGQITNTVQHNAAIVVYENILLLNKHRIKKLTISQFDFYWRMLRNFKIRTKKELLMLAKEQPISGPFETIIVMQERIPHRLLKISPISKLLMAISYFFSYRA